MGDITVKALGEMSLLVAADDHVLPPARCAWFRRRDSSGASLEGGKVCGLSGGDDCLQ